MSIPLYGYWKLLVDYLRPQWRRVVLLAFLLLSSIGLKVVAPQIIRFFIDSALSGKAGEQLGVAAAILLGVAVLIQVFSVAATYVGENVGWTATNNLRSDLALHCLRLDMSFHNDRRPGEMIERIDGDVVGLAGFFSQFVIKVLGNLLLLVGVLVAMYLTDWRIGIVVTLYSILSLYGLNRLRSIAVPHWKALREVSADLFGFIEEQLSGTEDIRSSGAGDYVMNNLYRHNQERLRKHRKAGLMESFLVELWVGLYELGRIIAFIGSYLLFTEQLISIGTAYLIVAYIDTIFSPLREITNQIQNLQKAGGSIERINDLYAIPNKIQDSGRASLPDGQLSVEFDDVSFAYNGTDTVLRDLSFAVEPGKVLGLLGRTGSGKTTITRLLFRLYDTTTGSIRLNGLAVKDIALAGLQQ